MTTNKTMAKQNTAYKNTLNDMRFSKRLVLVIIALLVPIVIQVIGTLVGTIYQAATLGVQDMSFAQITTQPYYIISTFIAEIIAIGIVIILLRKNLSNILSVFKNGKTAVKILLTSAIGLGVLELYSIFITHILKVTANANQELVEHSFTSLPAFAFFSVAIAAPFLEEVIYRIGLFGVIRKHNRVLAYIVSALVFALIHFTFDGNMTVELLNLPAYIGSGLLLCYMYDKYGFAGSFTTHMINNLIAATAIVLS